MTFRYCFAAAKAFLFPAETLSESAVATDPPGLLAAAEVDAGVV